MTAGVRRWGVAWACLWVSACAVAAGELSLARIDVQGPLSSFPLPVHARLQDASGQEYLLVKASADELDASGFYYELLDVRADLGTHILAFEFRDGARQAAQGQFDILLDDGKRLLIRATSAEEMESVSLLGFQCRLLGAEPMDLAPPARRGLASPRMVAVASNASVSAMMAQVRQTNLLASLNQLTGVQPVLTGGIYAAILTRHQNSGTPLQRATALAYDRLGATGLQASYQAWTASGKSNRNVVGVRTGTTAPSEIVVVCAHIDDMPSSGNAPGADDNASGSVAVLAAAEILRNYSFQRTIRFVIFTGEEQGLLGSEAYAQAAQAAGDHIVAVVNLDMVAWDENGDGALHLYVRPASDSGHAADRDIAATFTNVVRTYGLHTALSPRIIAEVSDWSDHYSFSSHGYPSICAIEEDIDDFNPYYHTANDTVDRLNLPYYTRFVQAMVGTVAHLARPVGQTASLSLAPASRTHSSAAANGQALSVSATMAWTATDNQPWITITSGASGSGNGTVIYGVSANGGVARTGVITVSGGGITRTCTVHQADGDLYEPDNSPSAAKAIGNTQLQNRSIHAAGNVDWVKFVVGGIGAKNLWLETAGTSDHDTQMWLFKGSNGAQLGYNDDISDANRYSRIRVATLSPGTHYIKIQDYSNDGTIPAYTLRANWATQYGPDAYESDNSASAARSIARGQTQFRNIHVAGNVDWVKFVVGSAGARNVVLETGGAGGDTQMWLYRGNGTPLRYDDNSGAGTFSRISVATLTPGTYFLKIQENGNNGTIPAYTLRAVWSSP